MLNTASSTLMTTMTRRNSKIWRRRRRSAGRIRSDAHADGRDRRQHEVAGRPGGRNHHELLLPVLPQVRGVHRHRLRPADERQVRSPSRSAETRCVPIGSMCTAGFSDTRPSSRAVGSPSRSADQACAASWNVSESRSTENWMKTCEKSMSKGSSLAYGRRPDGGGCGDIIRGHVEDARQVCTCSRPLRRCCSA